MSRGSSYRPIMPTAEDVQLARVQQVFRETVPDAICELSLYGTTVICSIGGVSVSFDRVGPSYADLGRLARRLEEKVAEASRGC